MLAHPARVANPADELQKPLGPSRPGLPVPDPNNLWAGKAINPKLLWPKRSVWGLFLGPNIPPPKKLMWVPFLSPFRRNEARKLLSGGPTLGVLGGGKKLMLKKFMCFFLSLLTVAEVFKNIEHRESLITPKTPTNR